MIVAIDGPAASGKGTIGARLARHLGFHMLDTGLLYRGVAATLLAAMKRPDNEQEAVRAARQLAFEALDERTLQTPEIGQAASMVAVMPALRAALLERQREFARRSPGAVLVGRDIGTVVCPDAEVKIYLTASAEARAARRADQLGIADGEERRAILEGIVERDRRDMTRAVAPLKQAADARLLDTTEMDIEASLRDAIGIVDGVSRRLT